jgi:signal transduction histidine kinase
MIVDAVRSLWAEPRAPGSTSPRWPDWLATAVLAVLAIVEGVLRDDLERPGVAVAFGLALLLLLPWRRARPLVVAVAAFGALKAFDLVTVAAGGDPDQSLLWQNVWVLALPFALLRWGSGRQIALGSVVMAIVPLTGHSLADAVFGLLLFTSSGALGVAFRFRAAARLREVDQVRLREREQLARELHDTVAHHVSAIAIQAQAGRAVAATDPDRAAQVLGVIEEAASRTLTELRAMVGVLRDDGEPELAPQRGIPDIPRLASAAGHDGPRVEVHLSGDLDDLSASVGAAVYRLAQESVTNALRHARDATCIQVQVTGDDRGVHLRVGDDGDPAPGDRNPGGYGIVGMTERAALLGGTFEAGPDPERGWTVEAVLPRVGTSR